jgi:hypothetical protein
MVGFGCFGCFSIGAMLAHAFSVWFVGNVTSLDMRYRFWLSLVGVRTLSALIALPSWSMLLMLPIAAGRECGRSYRWYPKALRYWSAALRNADSRKKEFIKGIQYA